MDIYEASMKLLPPEKQWIANCLMKHNFLAHFMFVNGGAQKINMKSNR